MRDPFTPRQRVFGAAKMRVAKSCWVFQAEAQRAIEADVRDVNERNLDEQRPPRNEAEQGEHERHEGYMQAIISDRAEARPREIKQHGEIGRKEERGEERPAAAEAAVCEYRYGRKGGALHGEQNSGPIERRFRRPDRIPPHAASSSVCG